MPIGPWTVDSDASTVRFGIKHLLVARVHGHFGAVSGVISAGDDEVRAAGSVDVTTIDTGDATRDERLRGPGFFDVERYPTIEFRATSTESRPDGTWKITGDLTMCGATSPLTFDVVVAEGPVVHATAALSRKQHGIDWPGLRQAGRAVVGDRVEIELEIVLR